MEDYDHTTAPRSAAMARFICSCALDVTLFGSEGKASRSKRLYVEPFATGSASEKLREDVVAELRKLNSVSLAPAESAADVVLGGGGAREEAALRRIH
jgi:hypothetical protein